MLYWFVTYLLLLFPFFVFSLIINFSPLLFSFFILWDKHFSGRVADVVKGIDTDLSGKHVIVTGGSSGIGLELVIALMRRGASVLFTSRTAKDGLEARNEILRSSYSRKEWGKRLEVWALNLDSFDNVRRFASEYIDSETPLDILVCNAGVMGIPHSNGPDGYEMNLTVNFLSQFLLATLLIPILEASACPSSPSRIIFTSSCLHWLSRSIVMYSSRKPPMFYERILAYARSKLFVLLAAREFNYRLQNSDIIVASVHPGAVATSLFRNFTFPLNFCFWAASKLIFLSRNEGKDVVLYACIAEPSAVSGKYLTRKFDGTVGDGWMNSAAKSTHFQRMVYDAGIKFTSIR